MTVENTGYVEHNQQHGQDAAAKGQLTPVEAELLEAAQLLLDRVWHLHAVDAHTVAPSVTPTVLEQGVPTVDIDGVALLGNDDTVVLHNLDEYAVVLRDTLSPDSLDRNVLHGCAAHEQENRCC